MKTYDYIVVGSGPGGGVVAYNLNKAGADVVLLEAGKFFRKNTFPINEADVSAQLYWGGGIEFDESAKMAFLRARLVGGTSIVNQALLDRFDDIAFKDWKTQSGVDFFNEQDMKSAYDTVSDFLSIYNFKREEMGKNAQYFAKSCDKLGYKWDFLHRGQSDCGLEKGNDCIACLGGCHRDSKQSTMATYIQRGEKEGLRVIAETEISHIEENADFVYVYGSTKGTKVKFKAKNVILAGGAFGTTKMLFQSGYKQKLSALGQNFSSHPQYMNFGVHDEEINSHKGFFQTVASKDPSFRQKGFKLECVFAGPVSIAMLFKQYGAAHQEKMMNYKHITCIETAVRDENTGEIKVDKNGKLVVQKNLTEQDKKRRDAGLEAVHNIMVESGAKEVIHAPFYFGLHLMGGAQMGVDGAKSVVAPDFKLHGSKRVYVCDSSLYPNAPGINPSLTIFALSQRLSEQLIK
ncbi:MAG: GMC family oxidoreductase N-terminal domain-containing protein [Chitinophagales bacterium]